MNLWFRHSKTKIKDSFKHDMKEWYLPEYKGIPHRWAEIHFTILRSNGRKIDSDALSSGTYKWTQDLLVELKYLIDDDQTRLVLNPTQLHCEGTIETSVRMQVKFYDKEQMHEHR